MSSTSSSFEGQIDRLRAPNLLYQVVSQVRRDRPPPRGRVSNIEMGYIYEELIRRFSELSNETAGEHFTPREVIRLMVNLLFIDDDDLLARRAIVRRCTTRLAGLAGCCRGRGPPAGLNPRPAPGVRTGAQR